MIRIAIAGVAGRMGRALVDASQEHQDIRISAALDRADSKFIGKDVGEFLGQAMNVSISGDLKSVVDHFDVLIDFTLPSASLDNLAVCRAAGKAMVIGTTGFTDQQKQSIAGLAKDMAIVLAPNMSIGVNLTYRLIELAARVMGAESDIEIVEAHHRNKVDAPSGTALKMGEVVAKTLGRNLDQDAIYGRQGNTGVRDRNTIGFSTIRAGDIVGEHTVIFAGAGERVEISHKASSRLTFAHGAIQASKWIMGQDKGLFDMQHVLGLS